MPQSPKRKKTSRFKPNQKKETKTDDEDRISFSSFAITPSNPEATNSAKVANNTNPTANELELSKAVTATDTVTKESSSTPSTSSNTTSAKKCCASCGSTSIDVDNARGDAVCTQCGEVVETNCIVSEVQFLESSGGVSMGPVGQFVSSDSHGGVTSMQTGSGPKSTYLGSQESREVTLRKAYNKIKDLAVQISLRTDHIDIAHNFYRLALNLNLTRGRKSTHMVAACVYITCRTEGTSHMLIDLAQVQQIDPFELGKVYLKLCQELCINIPNLDPCVYVLRFAHQMNFGGSGKKSHEVAMTALRLVSRMKKDWLHVGRRPSGLCGASLLIAARLHQHTVSVNEIIKVIHVSENTLKKRLREFGETSASQLTIDEFCNIDLDAMTEECDPPAFKEARRMDKLIASNVEQIRDGEDEVKRLLGGSTDDDISRLDGDLLEELNALKEEIDFKTSQIRSKKFKSNFKSRKKGVAGDQNVEKQLFSDLNVLTKQFLKERKLVQQKSHTDEDTLYEDLLVNDSLLESIVSASSNTDQQLMPPPKNAPTEVLTHERLQNSVEFTPGLLLRDSIDDYINAGTTTTSPQAASIQQPSLASQNTDELDIQGLDDDELNSYILSASERDLKSRLWSRLNAEFLVEEKEREEREALELKMREKAENVSAEHGEEDSVKKGRRRTRKRPLPINRNAGGGADSTATSSIMNAVDKVMQTKKISSKINYDVLNALKSVSKAVEDNKTNAAAAKDSLAAIRDAKHGLNDSEERDDSEEGEEDVDPEEPEMEDAMSLLSKHNSQLFASNEDSYY